MEELNEKNFLYTVCTKRREFLWLFMLWSSKVLSCSILYIENVVHDYSLVKKPGKEKPGHYMAGKKNNIIFQEDTYYGKFIIKKHL